MVDLNKVDIGQSTRDSDISTNITCREATAPIYMASMTLEEEALAGGWTRITKPVGGPVEPTFTAGTRGDPDLDADNTLKNDSSAKSSVTDLH